MQNKHGCHGTTPERAYVRKPRNPSTMHDKLWDGSCGIAKYCQRLVYKFLHGGFGAGGFSENLGGRFIKDGANELCKPIAQLINLSISKSMFPDQCKIFDFIRKDLHLNPKIIGQSHYYH